MGSRRVERHMNHEATSSHTPHAASVTLALQANVRE